MLQLSAAREARRTPCLDRGDPGQRIDEIAPEAVRFGVHLACFTKHPPNSRFPPAHPIGCTAYFRVRPVRLLTGDVRANASINATARS